MHNAYTDKIFLVCIGKFHALDELLITYLQYRIHQLLIVVWYIIVNNINIIAESIQNSPQWSNFEENYRPMHYFF